MMVSCCQSGLLVSLLMAVCVYAGSIADISKQCKENHVSVVVTVKRSQVDPALFRLGSCFPQQGTHREAVFNVQFEDCGFTRLVTADRVLHSSHVTLDPSADVKMDGEPIECDFERTSIDYPLIYETEFETSGFAALRFNLELMNSDFTGPAESNSFILGSLIPIMASVAQDRHQPLLLLLDECVASTTQDLRPGSAIHEIIVNKGCLIDGIGTRSTFEERQNSSELRLSLQAFKFEDAEEVFVRCKLVAWNPDELGNTRKACNYDEHDGWEQLDKGAYRDFCDCCGPAHRGRHQALSQGCTDKPKRQSLGHGLQM